MIKTFFTVCWIYIFAFSAYVGSVAYDYAKTQKLSAQTWGYWKDKDPQKMSHVELDASLKAYTKHLNDVVAKARAESLISNVTKEAKAETWELAIQPLDKDDLPSGHKRAKQGDIVAIKPYPWNWGVMELKNYLILVVTNMTEEEAEQIAQPLYLNDTAGTVDVNGMLIPGVITYKRKYQIDIDKLKTNILPTLDKTKLEDKTKETNYQPFKDGGIQIAVDMLEADLIKNKYNLKWKKGKKIQ